MPIDSGVASSRMLASIDYPTAVGPWRIRGNTLTCRLPGRDVMARAPGPLLRAVHTLCDGRLHRQAVTGTLGQAWSPADVAGFLQGLTDQGLLLDRDDAALLQGPGHRTFGNAPLRVEQLQWVLQRAIATAGSRALRWQVEVLQPLPLASGLPLAPGRYAVSRSADGSIGWQPLAGGPGASSAWRSVPDPRVLTFASAVVVPRSTAGTPESSKVVATAVRALLVAQRCAESVGLGHVLFQELPADSSAPGVAGRQPLSALVLGTAATPAEAKAQRTDQWLPLGPAATRLQTPTPGSRFAFSAGAVREGPIDIVTVGRAADPRTALRKAEAEAWERLGWARPGALIESTRLDLPTARDPRSLVAYAAWQHARPGFPFAPFDPGRPALWCEGVQVGTGTTVHLPAECIHALQALPAHWRRKACTSTSTSGVAAGPDAETAFVWALLEAIERDAFLRAWLARRPACTIATAALPGQAQRRVRALRARGHRVDVLQLPAVAPVYGVLVQSRQQPFTVVTAGAHFDPEEALCKALDEAEGCSAHASAHAVTPLGAMQRVRSIADQMRYWRSPRSAGRAAFLASGPPSATFITPGLATDRRSLLAALATRGLDPLAFDITPAGASVDQGRQPLRVIRAAVPGLLPIWFAHGLEPAGLPAFRAVAGQRRRPVPVHPFP